MINGKTVLAIIPARGGSKGVPKKNILSIGGKPLIAWTIQAAKNATFIDRLILSSDCQEIIETALKYGCEVPFVRPDELATDQAGSAAVVSHALASLKESYDYVVLLQPTSIFRSTEDIEGAVQYCVDNQVSSCVSVVECEKPPYWIYHIQDKKLVSVIKQNAFYSRRQDCPPTYELNGAVYVIATEAFNSLQVFVSEDTLPYVMPKSRSLDIDTEEDIMLAKYRLSE